jgi:hypothetical protein
MLPGQSSPLHSTQTGLLKRSNTLAGMVPGIAGAVLLPAYTVSMGHSQGSSRVSIRLSSVDTCVAALSSRPSLLSSIRSVASPRGMGSLRPLTHTAHNLPVSSSPDHQTTRLDATAAQRGRVSDQETCGAPAHKTSAHDQHNRTVGTGLGLATTSTSTTETATNSAAQPTWPHYQLDAQQGQDQRAAGLSCSSYLPTVPDGVSCQDTFSPFVTCQMPSDAAASSAQQADSKAAGEHGAYTTPRCCQLPIWQRMVLAWFGVGQVQLPKLTTIARLTATSDSMLALTPSSTAMSSYVALLHA